MSTSGKTYSRGDRDGPFWDCRRACDHWIYFTAQECIEVCEKQEQASVVNTVYSAVMGMPFDGKCRRKCVEEARAPLPKCYEKCSEEFRGRKMMARYQNSKQAQATLPPSILGDPGVPESSPTTTEKHYDNENDRMNQKRDNANT